MELFDTFPREVSKTRIFVTDKAMLDRFIKRWNGKIDCYASVYKLSSPRNYESAVIDKLFFDMDGKDAYKTMKKLNVYLCEKNYEHDIVFSGGGYHCYVMCKVINLNNKKNAVKNAQEFIIKEADIKGKVDPHVIGDIARISRIPGTWNIKRRKKCEYLGGLINSKKFDLKPFDTEELLYKIDYTNDDSKSQIELTQFKGFMKQLPPFIINLLQSTKCGWRDRYYTILGMKEAGIPKNICQQICKHYWTPQKFEHCVVHERQLDYIYKRQDLFFPLWNNIECEGYRITKQDKEFKFYKGD